MAPPIFTQPELEQLKSRLLAGEGQAVEQEIFSRHAKAAGDCYQELIHEVTHSPEGIAVARRLMVQAGYRELKKVTVTVTIQNGLSITVPSYYARKQGKKKGPLKRGPNGRGIHLLLAYWGYINKYSPCHVDQVARCGVGSASYDLAEAELRSQGMEISSKTVDHIVQVVGGQALDAGPEALLVPGETLAGKRVMISTDGGRIRSRVPRTGRPYKDQKQPHFDTPWREPKLLVISELDDQGNKRRHAIPIYEATMGNPSEVFRRLKLLADKLQLDQAQEVVSVNDGAPWIWNLFNRLQDSYPNVPMTGIVDFFHACEHITELTQAHTEKTVKQQRAWAKTLQQLLRSGQFDGFTKNVRDEAAACLESDQQGSKLSSVLLKHLEYFETKQQYMHYDQYEAAKLPIGSGIVESAVKRVINGRLKAPGSFWKIVNVEKILHLRCALMAGRWDTLMTNLRAAGPLGDVRV